MKLFLFVVVIYTVCIAADNKSDKKVTPRSEAFSWQFTYQVSLQKKYSGHFCSGAILNKRFILTTAYCVFAEVPSLIHAILGAHDLNEYGQRVKIKSIKKHASFDLISMKNDIALLNTIEEIEFSSLIHAITLPPSVWLDEYAELTVSGWDKLESKKQLQYQPVNVKDCKPHITYSEQLSNGVICAASNSSLSTFNPGKGSLLTDENGHLVGILSEYRSGILERPDTYTRIPSHVSWIEENSKIETVNSPTIPWTIIIDISKWVLVVIGISIIVVLVVKYAMNQNGETPTVAPAPAPTPAPAPATIPAPAPEPTTTVMPTVSSINYPYPYQYPQVPNLQPVNAGVPQYYVPIAPPLAQYPAIPEQITPPPNYGAWYPNEQKFGSPPQHQS